jgi:aminopeptidase
MYEDFAPKLARLMTEYSQPVEPGQFVVIRGTLPAKSLILALYEGVLRRGGHPHIWIEFTEIEELFFELASDEQLAFVDPVLKARYNTPDIVYWMVADENTNYLGASDPARRAIHNSKVRKPLRDIALRREAEGLSRWCGVAWPTYAKAQAAGMGLRAFTRFVYEACGLNQDDPVAYWQAFRDRQQVLVDWLSGKKHATVQGPGIDMTFDFQDRVWVNCCGKGNLPDGEIFIGPVEDSVNGRVEFNMPSQFWGEGFYGVELTFKDGVVIEASVEQGEDRFLALIDTDEGARRLGEFAIGTNPFIQSYMGHPLYDEKIGGTIHMALGFSIPESKGANESAIHFDMVHDMRAGGEIHIDGELFYKAGEFMVE